MNVIASLAAGLVFGLGLIIAGMADPAKVLGFLDIAGLWDPSLALVMAGAIAVGLGAFAMAGRRTHALLGLPLEMPKAQGLDRRLIVGSALFGIGWGLAGICPGPALVLVGAGAAKGTIFTLAMIAGMALFEALERLSSSMGAARAMRVAPPPVP